MKKFGFTLAEVLITLGIIGVVAALTAPALVTSSRNQAMAARLSVIVSNFENALQNMIVEEGADNIYQTRLGASGLSPERAGLIGRYLHLTYLNQNPTGFYANVGGTYAMDVNGSRNSAADAGFGTLKAAAINAMGGGDFATSGNAAIMSLKQGGTIFLVRSTGRAADITEAAMNAAAADGRAFISRAYDVIIDVNGPDAPNTYGRDIFAFILGANGVLYPYGSRDTAIAGLYGANTDGTCNNGRAITNGLGCTARIIQDGYQMNY